MNYQDEAIQILEDIEDIEDSNALILTELLGQLLEFSEGAGIKLIDLRQLMYDIQDELEFWPELQEGEDIEDYNICDL